VYVGGQIDCSTTHTFLETVPHESPNTRNSTLRRNSTQKLELCPRRRFFYI